MWVVPFWFGGTSRQQRPRHPSCGGRCAITRLPCSGWPRIAATAIHHTKVRPLRPSACSSAASSIPAASASRCAAARCSAAAPWSPTCAARPCRATSAAPRRSSARRARTCGSSRAPATACATSTGPTSARSRGGGRIGSARWDFGASTTLVREHNAWYPVERDLPMDPRTGDYVPVNGRSYRREELDAAWALRHLRPREQPPGIGRARDGGRARRRAPPPPPRPRPSPRGSARDRSRRAPEPARSASRWPSAGVRRCA